MIEDPPLLTIRRRFKRPAPQAIAALRGVPTGVIVDALGGRGAVSERIKPIIGPAALCGPALTCAAGPGDNLALFGALSVAVPGDILACATDGFTATAVAGDLLLGMMKNRKLGGLLTDGAVRDIVGIRAVGLPCFAQGLTPNSAVRSGPGTVGQSIVLGGVAISSGDIVVADEDGVVIVPSGRIEAVLERVPAVQASEAELLAKVNGGLEVPDFVQALIDAGSFRDID